MKIEANSPEEYIAQLPEERKAPMERLRKLLTEKLPEGFSESMSYGMIAFGVPHSIYPAGYHCKPEEPVPFISIASQKNNIALYHMGLYADPELTLWFQEEYKKIVGKKADMGKSCIRLKKIEQIPFDLIEELITKITVKDWINTYESSMKK